MKNTWVTFEPDTALAETLPQPNSQPFDIKFEKADLRAGEGGLPLAMLKDQSSFSNFRHIRVEAAPVKCAGTLTHCFHHSYKQFMEIIQLAAAYEAAHSDLFVHKEGYIAIRQTQLQKDGCQPDRYTRDWHTDFRNYDMKKGKRLRPLQDHIYIACDLSPTRIQKYPLSDAFNELSADPGKGYQAEPYEVNFLNNMTWHKTTPAEQDGVRTFVRIVYQSPDREYMRQHFTQAELDRYALKL